MSVMGDDINPMDWFPVIAGVIFVLWGLHLVKGAGDSANGIVEGWIAKATGRGCFVAIVRAIGICMILIGSLMLYSIAVIRLAQLPRV
jgi:hypothetical protein